MFCAKQLTDLAIYGATILPTRAAHEHAPKDEFLTTVGINSAVNMKIMLNAAVAPALPMNARTTVSGCKSETKINI